MTRLLIVNADDLGASPGVNRGIFEVHQHGIVTSASLMVRQPGAQEAAALLPEHPRLSVGLHLDLGEWVYCDGEWHAAYEIADAADEAAVERELERQLELFQRLTGRTPTHLDSHQHVHLSEPAAGPVAAAGARLGIPVRRSSDAIHYEGRFYGQSSRGEPTPDAVGVNPLLRIIRTLPEGCTELCCHPGYADGLRSSYCEERELEIATLCDPRIAAEIASQGIELVSFEERA